MADSTMLMSRGGLCKESRRWTGTMHSQNVDFYKQSHLVPMTMPEEETNGR